MTPVATIHISEAEAARVCAIIFHRHRAKPLR